MSHTKSHLYGLVIAALAAASGSSHATTYEAAVSWSGPIQSPYFGPNIHMPLGPNGPIGESAYTYTPPLFASPGGPASYLTHCGLSYYQQCVASASSYPTSMTTSSHNNGLGTLVATAGFTDTFTNTSGQTQSYSFDFHLTNVSLYSRSYFGVPVESKVTADILINGVSVWNTSQSWLEDQNGSHFFSDGADISSGLTINQWGWRTYDYSSSVNLGSFASGSSFTVQYVLSSYATASDPHNCGYECQEARATIDDPFAVNAASAIHVTSSVPEPETYALFAAGLAMVFGARRRATRSKKQTMDC